MARYIERAEGRPPMMLVPGAHCFERMVQEIILAKVRRDGAPSLERSRALVRQAIRLAAEIEAQLQDDGKC